MARYSLNLAMTAVDVLDRAALINRYYDPATGQFLTVDPAVGVTGSAYGYVSDNPTNGTDPTGLCNSKGQGRFWDVFNPFSTNNPIRCAEQNGSNRLLEANPAYQAIQHGYNAYEDAQSSCSSNWSIAWESAQALFWSADTVGTALSPFSGGEADSGISQIVKTRRAPGSDGGVSRHIIEQENGETVSVTHQVSLDGDIIHQHQTYVGKYGGQRQFPDEWSQYPDIGTP